MQISERVKVHIAMKRHMRPVERFSDVNFPETLEHALNTPVPPVGEDQLLLVKCPRLEPAHVSVSEEVVNGSRVPDRNEAPHTIHCLLKD